MERGRRSEAFCAEVDGCHHRINYRKSLKAAAGHGEPRAVFGDLSQTKKAGACLVVNDTKPQNQVRSEEAGHAAPEETMMIKPTSAKVELAPEQRVAFKEIRERAESDCPGPDQLIERSDIKQLVSGAPSWSCSPWSISFGTSESEKG